MGRLRVVLVPGAGRRLQGVRALAAARSGGAVRLSAHRRAGPTSRAPAPRVRLHLAPRPLRHHARRHDPERRVRPRGPRVVRLRGAGRLRPGRRLRELPGRDRHDHVEGRLEVDRRDPRPRDAPGRRRAPVHGVRRRDRAGHRGGAPNRPHRDGALHGGRRDDRERARSPRRALRARRPDVRDRVQRVEPARRRREGPRRRWAHPVRSRRGPSDEPARDGDRSLPHGRRDRDADLRGERAARVPVAFRCPRPVLRAQAEGGRPPEGGGRDRRR